MSQTIQLNIIPFKPVEEKLTFPFYGDKLPDRINYSIKWDKLFDNFPENREANKQSYFTDFVTHNENAIIKEVDVFNAINFSEKYFRYQLFNYFTTIHNAVVQSNFIDDVEVWFLDEKVKHRTYKTYNKFTLKVDYKNVSNGYE